MLRTEPVIERIWATGATLRRGLADLIAGATFDVQLLGNPPRSSLAFGSPELRGMFLQECHKRGVLFGGPIFPSYRHTEADVRQTLEAAAAAFARMEEAHGTGDYAAHLEGRPPGTVFRSHD